MEKDKAPSDDHSDYYGSVRKMDLKTSIEELKRSLLESDAFLRYQKIREEVHNYPEKEHRLHEFRRKNYFLQNSREQIDLFTEADRLEQEYADVYKDPLLGEFLAAEVAVCRIIQQVNQELIGCLDFEAILYEE